MPEPTLQEIIGNADPERGTGTPAVVYDNSELVRTLNQAAQFKAENDWRKYGFFMNNLKEVYKDLGEIQKQPIMQEDRQQVNSEMGEILKEIGKNPHNFFGGGPKYAEMQSRIGKLQSDVTQSKQDYLFNEANRGWLLRNEHLNTPDNQNLIGSFGKQKLGSRQLYQLTLPGIFDPDALAEGINKQVKYNYKQDIVSPDQQFINRITGTKYDPEKFLTIADQFYYMKDPRGIPLSETVKKRYDELPYYVKEIYSGDKEPALAYYRDLMKTRMAKDELNTQVISNPNYLGKEKLAVTARHYSQQDAIDWMKYNLDKDKFDKANTEDLYGAGSVINEALSYIKNGSKVTVWEGDAKTKKGKNVEYIRIDDPELMKEFALLRTETTADGTDIKRPVQYVDYDPKTDMLYLRYQDLDKNGQPKKGHLESVPVQARKWLSTKVKGKYPTREIGGINQLIDEVLIKNKNSLYSLLESGAAEPTSTGAKSITGDTDPSTLSDGEYNVTSGKLKGKTIVVKKGQISLK